MDKATSSSSATTTTTTTTTTTMATAKPNCWSSLTMVTDNLGSCHRKADNLSTLPILSVVNFFPKKLSVEPTFKGRKIFRSFDVAKWFPNVDFQMTSLTTFGNWTPLFLSLSLFHTQISWIGVFMMDISAFMGHFCVFSDWLSYIDWNTLTPH